MSIADGDAAAIEATLRADRVETEQRMRALQADFDGVVEAQADVATDDEHDPEGATIAFERSRVAALVEQARRHLGEIDAALGRLAAGTFGICERCGRPIESARLSARPVARTCIDCAR